MSDAFEAMEGLDEASLWMAWGLEEGPDTELNPNAASLGHPLKSFKDDEPLNGGFAMKLEAELPAFAQTPSMNVGVAEAADALVHFHPSQLEPLNSGDYAPRFHPDAAHNAPRPQNFYAAFAQAYQPGCGFSDPAEPRVKRSCVAHQDPCFVAVPPPPQQLLPPTRLAPHWSNSSRAPPPPPPPPPPRRLHGQPPGAEMLTLLAVADDLRNADPGPASTDERVQRVFTWNENMCLLVCAFCQEDSRNPFKQIIGFFNRAMQERAEAVSSLGHEASATASLRPLRDRSSLRKRLQKLLHQDQLAKDWHATRRAAAELFLVSAAAAKAARGVQEVLVAQGLDKALCDGMDMVGAHMRSVLGGLAEDGVPLSLV